MTFNALIPELYVTDLQRSLVFYTQLLGFKVAYDRPEEGFAFLGARRRSAHARADPGANTLNRSRA